MTATTTSIGRLQSTAALLVLGLLGLQIPVISLAQVLFAESFSWREPLFCAACLAVGALAHQALPSDVGRFALAALLAASGLASVSAFAGHDFQPGMQVYAYVLVAVVVGFCDWRANALAAATVVVGTAAVAAFSPAAAGWRGGQVFELGLYLWLAAFTGALLAWLAHTLADAFARAEAAVVRAEEAHAEVVAATKAAAAADAKALADRREMLDGIARGLDVEIAALAKDVAGEAGTAKADAGTLHGSVDVGVSQVNTLSTENARARGAAEAVAQATQQLSGAIDEITHLVARSADMSRSATDKARATAGIIEGLSEAATSIEAVVASIAGIAGTTNLLALNATIEAARAGEAGRGFAVVAEEVKGLAGQTAKATAEAGERIAALRESTRHAADALRAIAETIYEIDAAAKTIAAAVATQDSSTKEIVRSAADAAAGAEAASAATGAVGAAWADVRTRADSIGELSDRLVDQTGRLTQAIRGFVGRLSNA